MSKHLFYRLLEQPYYNDEIKDLINKYPCGNLYDLQEKRMPFWKPICKESKEAYIKIINDVVEKFKLYNEYETPEEIDDTYNKIATKIYNNFIKEANNDDKNNEGCKFCKKKCNHENAVSVLSKLGAFLMMYENYKETNEEKIFILEAENNEDLEKIKEEIINQLNSDSEDNDNESENDNKSQDNNESENDNESKDDNKSKNDKDSNSESSKSDDEEDDSDDELEEPDFCEEEKELFNKFCDSFNLIINPEPEDFIGMELITDSSIIETFREKFKRNDLEIRWIKKKAFFIIRDKLEEQFKEMFLNK